MRQRPERGAALLEAIVALAVLSAVGSVAVGVGIEAAAAVRQAQDHEARVRTASRFLEAVALWPADDLDRHFGTHRQGPWLLTVDRPAERVYVLTLRDTVSQARLLETAVFRPGRIAP